MRSEVARRPDKSVTALRDQFIERVGEHKASHVGQTAETQGVQAL